MVVQSSRNKILRYQGVDLDPVNWGWLCDKGRFGFEAVNSDERLASPLLRDKGLLLEPTSWSAALERATSALERGLDRSGPEGVAVLGGARLTNEDAYAWVKLAKGVIGTDSVDCQMDDGLPAPAVVGLPRATIDEVCAPGGVVLLMGPDIKEELPVLYLRLRHAARNDDVALVELSSVGTGVTDLTTHSLRYRPGEVYPLVRAILETAAGGDGDDIPTEVAGVRADQIEDVARLVGERPLTVVLGRGNVAEASEAVAEAARVIHEARPEVRFLSALRRANVHGALDMGMSPGLLPGRANYEMAGEAFAGVWPRVPNKRGLDAAGILQAAADGKIDTLLLVGADPLNDFPDRDLAERGLAGARTVIACDLFLTESVKQAEVVLPAAGFAEVAGTTTNLEGRVSTVSQKVTPPGTAQSDWVIAADLARRLGYDLGIESPRHVWDELAGVVPAFGAIGELLARADAADGVLVPLPNRRGADADVEATADAEAAADAPEGPAPETATVAAGTAVTGDDVAAGALETAMSSEAPPASHDGHVIAPDDLDGFPLPTWTAVEPPMLDPYSLRLVTTRKLYDRGTLLRHSGSLVGLGEGAVVRLNPYDFEKLGVSPGDDVRLASLRTHVLVPARPSEQVPRGVALLHLNQSGGRANAIIDANLAVTDVRVEKA
jgi:NADH-quinone oxidoreductase subunit G